MKQSSLFSLRFSFPCRWGEMNRQQDVVAAVIFKCQHLVALAVVTHQSLMFSHRGSAGQDCCGAWEQFAGWKMKRESEFESDVLLILFQRGWRRFGLRAML